jgi:tRNA-binding protein
MCVGTIVQAEIFAEARKPAYKMLVDFGPLGTRKTSAQITDLYAPSDLIGRQVIAVVNFPPKQIANIKSECLILGAVGDDHVVTLLAP